MQENSAYATLGVTKGISEKDLRLAYVQLVKKYDPEKHTDRFMVIQKAYDKLKNVKTRVKEDVFTYNVPRGEYLFQAEEKVAPEAEEPDEAEVAAARLAYQEAPADDTLRAALITLLFRRTHYYTIRKQWDKAIRDWTEVLEIDPTHARARHNLELACASLGVSYAMHGLNEDAIELWERVLQLNPDNTDIVHNLALCSEKLPDPPRAMRHWNVLVERWKRQLARDPENDYLRLLVVEALNHQAEYAEEHPEANFGPATPGPIAGPQQPSSPTVARSPIAPPQQPASSANNPRAFTAPRAPGAPQSGQPSSPQIPIDQVITPPQAPDTRVNEPPRAGWSRTVVPKMTTSQTDIPKPAGNAGIDRYRDIVRLKPDDFDAHFQLCNKLMEERLWDEALTELEALAAKHPRNVEVLNLMGWALLNGRQKEKAFAVWKRSMSIDPRNPSTREQLVRANLLMGKSYREKGLFTHALVHFKQLLSLMPDSAEVHLEIAATYDMKGDVRSAVAEYNEVLKLDPKNKVAKKAVTDLRMKR